MNPMEFKKRLARELVAQFHDNEASRTAEAYFEKTVQGGQLPDEIPRFVRPKPAQERLSQIMVEAKLVDGASEAKRLINQGAVEINGETVRSNVAAATIDSGSVLQVGPRRVTVVEYRDG